MPAFGPEGFGIPYIEAMASGCPVVATPNPGAIEVTGGGRYGIVVDDEHLGAALLRLLGSVPERERLAEVGSTRAAGFDLRLVASAYEALQGAVQPSSQRRLTTVAFSRPSAQYVQRGIVKAKGSPRGEMPHFRNQIR